MRGRSCSSAAGPVSLENSRRDAAACARPRPVRRRVDVGTTPQAFSEKHRKVPIAVFDTGDVVVESSTIVDELLARRPPSDDAFAGPDARHWASWATADLATMMYPNITRTYAECRAALAYRRRADSERRRPFRLVFAASECALVPTP